MLSAAEMYSHALPSDSRNHEQMSPGGGASEVEHQLMVSVCTVNQ